MRRLLVLLAACHGDPQRAAVDGPVTTDAASDVAAGPLALSSHEVCKLLSSKTATDPSPNDVQHRANVYGADLGIPVVHDDALFLLFGDTIGYAGIWGAGESHPDAIGFARDGATAIAAHPEMLCDSLGILTLPAAQSIGPMVDPTVVADFAAAGMAAPSGHQLSEYIRDPASGNGTTFPYLPGDFEVPSGAFAYGDSIYVFYTTVGSPTDLEMKGSYLVKWTQPQTTGTPAYQILYAVDERFDDAGPLHGHFINIAAEVSGDYVYLFGTGAYRASPIYLARKRLDQLATPGAFEELGVVIDTPGYGETSVRYVPSLQRWLLLAQESLPGSNRIVMYQAVQPQGPWGAPTIVHDMADPGFRTTYCCTTADDCEGVQMFDCAQTGFYGTYLFPAVTGDASAFTITYTMSSFAPYDAAVFQTIASQ